MAVSTRLIRRRIKSIKNTRKITKAMQLVAASKTKRAVNMTLSSRAYAVTARMLVDEIMHLADPSLHTMLAGGAHTSKPKILLILCASDRGLCGGFNAQIIKKGIEFVSERGAGQTSIVAVGKNAMRAARRMNLDLLAAFESIANAPSFMGSRPIGKLATEEFASGRINRVFIAYTDYQSAIKQEPVIKQILPIIPESELEHAKNAWIGDEKSDIKFEPNPSRVLNLLLPKLVQISIFHALLESAASEHSSRMMAMQSATDNATTMVDGLTLAFNQARQAAITQEISEISAGKAAIE